MFSVIDKVFGERHSPQDKAHFLEVSRHNSAYFGQADPTPKVVTAKVNALLRAHSASYDALLLLDCFVDVLPHHVVKADVATWTRSVGRMISCKKSDPGQHIAWNVLEKLLRRLAKYAELSKDAPDIVSTVLQKILEELSPEAREPREGALRCLHTCMKHFGLLLGSQQGMLEKLLCRHLVAWNSSPTQELVCQCLALLPWCCRGGVQKQSEVWSAQMCRLLATANICLDSLFEDLHVAKSNVPTEAALPLDVPTSPSAHSTVFLNWRRVQNSSHAIQLMLSTGVSHTVPVPSEDILHVVCRMLSMSPSLMYLQPTAHEKMIASIMPSLQCSALELLKQLILSCRQALSRNTVCVTEMILQVILRTAPQPSVDVRRLRRAAYAALSLWLHVCKSGISLEGRVDLLMSVLLKDVQIITGSVELNRKGNGGALGNSFVAEDDSHVAALEDLCEQALYVLRQIIATHGTRLKPDLLQEVQRSMVVLLLKIQQLRYNFPQPYGSPRCRSALYSALFALMVNFNSSVPPPLHCCLRIFSAGLHDCAFEVSELCSHALACGSLIAHPQSSSLSRQALSGQALRCTRMLSDMATQTATYLPNTSTTGTQTMELPPPVHLEAKHRRPLPTRVQAYSNYRGEVYSDGEECDDEFDEEELYDDVEEEDEHHNGVRTHNGSVAITERGMYFKHRLPVKRRMNRLSIREESSAKRQHSEDVDDEESLEDESLGSMDEEEDMESESGAEDASPGDMAPEMELIDLDNECNDEGEDAPDETIALSSEVGSVHAPSCKGETVESDEPLEAEPGTEVVPEPDVVPEQNVVADSVETPPDPASKRETEEGSAPKVSEVSAKAEEEMKGELEATENHVHSTAAEECAEREGEEVVVKVESVEQPKTEDADAEEASVSEPQKGTPAEIKEGPDVAEMLLDFVDCSPDE